MPGPSCAASTKWSASPIGLFGCRSGRAKWYAPKVIPAAAAPALLVAYIGSTKLAPSDALAIANRTPDAATLVQSIVP